MGNSVDIRNLTGLAGGEVITGPRTVTGDWNAIFCVDAVTLGASGITSNLDQSTSSLSSKALSTNATIFGRTSQIDITSGTVIAYTTS
jgi:hypothetical protein